MRELPTGTVTFLFTDIEGSTKLLHELGDAYAEALVQHRRVLREAFLRHGGIEVDTQGDAFFVAFARASDAVAAAADAQAAFESGPIGVRMGLHTGRPAVTDEGYVGVDVHLGARIAAAAHGGQVLLSSAARAQIDAEVVDLGEHRLKDFAEPVPVFQLGSGRFPPLKTISNTNLPRPASSFVGREAELAAVRALLAGGARLVTLTGPGGCGKTRLALEVAADLVPEFKAGVFWIGLAPLRDPALVLDTVRQTLGAKEGLADHIGDRELLLLLDNLEHVVEAAPELASLVEACPNLRLLVTSRELLRVRGEVEHAVPPLDEPEAVALFCARAQVDRDETIAELCRRLDNLPLAVELAAARTSVLSPLQILERLSQRLDLLKGGRDAEARQQTLRTTIEWSHELLPDEERRLFARLAVFRGGCTLDAAEDVVDAGLDLMQSLVEKNLLRHSDERFWMLETIRDYAQERLDASGEASTIHDRLAEHFARFVEQLAPPVGGRAGREAQDRLTADYDNVRAALAWTFENGREPLGVRIAVAVGGFWLARGHLREGEQWLRKAVRTEDKKLRADALHHLAWLVAWQGRADEAQSLAEERLSLCRELGDLRGACLALHLLAGLAVDQGAFDRSRSLQEEAVAIAREMRDPQLLASRVLALGLELRRVGDYDAATSLFEEAGVLAIATGDLYAQAYAATALAGVRLRQNRPDDACALAAEGIRLIHEAGVTGPALATMVDTAAAALARRGRAAAAARLCAYSAALREQKGMVMDADDRVNHEYARARSRGMLDAETWSAELERGQAMSDEEMVALVRGEIDDLAGALAVASDERS